MSVPRGAATDRADRRPRAWGLRRRLARPRRGSSPHHYLLREWLVRAGLDPDRDVRLCVLPPPQMDRQLASGYLDGFCVGEPWNTAAELDGTGRVVAATPDVAPGHPNKVVAAN